MESSTATVDGVPMRWLENGTGFPAVLVHGIPTNPALFRRVMPLLTGVRCLAWEMVGYGASIPAGRDRDISVGRQAEYLASWLDSRGVGPAVLVGHDLGGGVVQIVATRRPDLCAGLVLTNAIGYDSWPIPSVKLLRAMAPVVERFPLPALRAVLSSFIRRGHDHQRAASDAIRVHWEHYARHDGAAAFARQLRSLDVDDTLSVAPALPSLSVPARVVWGEADRFQKVAYGERLARDLGAPLDRIAGGKHFTPEDHPHRVALAIAEVAMAAAPRARAS